MLEVAIRQMLLAAPAVVALVGQRIHPWMLPADTTFPALTYFLPVEDPDESMEGPTGIVEATVQVSAWAIDAAGKSGYLVARELAGAVNDALLGKSAVVGVVDVQAISGGRLTMDPPEADIALYHAIREYEVTARIGR